ncbi:MurR/RpiR family transcriptional regulator [Salibacterium halotolerans]|uniref:DNA-binding transcriptional regulator, MurR/RpiR family, contains HTH and SIS domains n=1 Tax=Salibacterium halotolerans TaxID=1884432 RepID=A0A1I5WRI7_9BACI|nr:MurR/RpiR family transcriptional regulator [Salibacterium halotolerans]SFQ22412.1 DNA-binding transcriptional regulator, MurR/RpiR family, contains HTH and SIS domains [Salibacterium halotolerans]
MFTNEEIASLNELETSLYQYIMKNMEKTAYMRIRELAEATHVSTTTILRFCRKNGCEGFSEFKVKLKMHLENRESTVVKDSRHAVSEFFERTLAGNMDDNIQKAADIIQPADHVLFIGIGSSGILAEYGARYFSSLGTFSVYIKDPYYPIHTHVLERSVIIALSVSGENRYTTTHIHQLKEKGSTVIAITNTKHSTIASMADLTIPYYVTEEAHQGSNITTQIPVIYLLETIAREVYKKNQAHDV